MKKVTIYEVSSIYLEKNLYFHSITAQPDVQITPYEVEIPDDFEPLNVDKRCFYDSRNHIWGLDGKATWIFEGEGENRKIHTHLKVWLADWDPDVDETITLIDTDTTS